MCEYSIPQIPPHIVNRLALRFFLIDMAKHTFTGNCHLQTSKGTLVDDGMMLNNKCHLFRIFSCQQSHLQHLAAHPSYNSSRSIANSFSCIDILKNHHWTSNLQLQPVQRQPRRVQTPCYDTLFTFTFTLNT